MNAFDSTTQTSEQKSFLGKGIRFCLENKVVVFLLMFFVIGWGVLVAPFDWELGGLPRNPVPVDAIPDIGENQQIVFTEWMGRSPQDIEDQITYPLTVSLLGVPGVKTVRSYSFFGFSSVYIIFKEGVDFYWSRSRVLEKLNSLPSGTLPTGVSPALGPDATALGQVYWYTLEGLDAKEKPAGGWDPQELRTVQDWYVRYALLSADGVSEVASIGGYVKEYQIDVDPDLLRHYKIKLPELYDAIRSSNIDVGAKTIEINQVEYLLRGIGFVKNITDIENSVVKVVNNIPVLVKHVAHVTLGPALRRGALDKDGAGAVGGVVVARYGDNPLAVIKNIKLKIAEISQGLPKKAVIDYGNVTVEKINQYAKHHKFDAFKKGVLNSESWILHLSTIDQEEWPDWVTISQVNIVPFYDRSGLIYETLGTLNSALFDEILVSMIVVMLMVMNLRSSILISGLLPISVLMCFIAMKTFNVDANVVALSGIAIAIGTMVDMSIVLCENILRHLEIDTTGDSKLEIIHRAACEVGSAVLTAVFTTVISFLPVFTMIGAEGKLFKPLAFTKTFALLSSVIVALVIIPPIAHIIFCEKIKKNNLRKLFYITLVGLSLVLLKISVWAGIILFIYSMYAIFSKKLPAIITKYASRIAIILSVIWLGSVLTEHWLPLGVTKGFIKNFIFVTVLMGSLLSVLWVFQLAYATILKWCLRHRKLFLCAPVFIVLFGALSWLGFDKVFSGPVHLIKYVGVNTEHIYGSALWQKSTAIFPGLGKEFMPSLDEGSYLYMPTTMVHASIGEAMDVLSKQDLALKNIPEIESVVGKIGRAETPLDPAPISMMETVINYKPEYIIDKNGKKSLFKYDDVKEIFMKDIDGNLIPDNHGKPFRQWRDTIQTPDDIWEAIVAAAQIEGTTSPPKLQPIATRIVMLQSGMRAPMGIKVKGPSLEIIDQVSLQLEKYLKDVKSVAPGAVFADRIVGKPYLEIIPDRESIARYGIPIKAFHDVIEVALGGKKITNSVEGRERYPIRVRYQRELRDTIEAIEKVLISGVNGEEIPLIQLADIKYVRGPQAIKSEDTFLIGYVLFDKKEGFAEVDVVEDCKKYLNEKIKAGEILLPPGVSYTFAGNYQNQIRSEKTLAMVLPLALFVIFMILYFQFKSFPTTMLVFSGIFVAWGGGFILLWLYGEPWFLNFTVFDVNLRDLFQVHPINLSVAVWVGFLALFGIASDDGVIISTYLEQIFKNKKPATKKEIHEAILLAGKRRIRPCLMTVATTFLALLPVLSSSGRGADVMVPMAIPTFGGMAVVLITIFVVPVLYSIIAEFKLKLSLQKN